MNKINYDKLMLDIVSKLEKKDFWIKLKDSCTKAEE